jgi:uncharacterized membrane protein (UPF0127 family)
LTASMSEMYVHPTENKMSKGKKQLWIWSIIIFLVFVVGAILINRYIVSNKEVVKQGLFTNNSLEPKFTPEGSLNFIKSTDSSVISRIVIEIADDDASSEKGLMYRRSMADSLGMLFIFKESEPRTFWMKNTYIPLDIIFIDEKFSIVSIQKDAVPFSETSLPSKENAKYVVEVNAGYTDSHKIKVGNGIHFIRNKN